MRILDRYIFKSVLSIFSLCLSIFLSLYIIIDIFSYLEDILKQHVGINTLVRYYIIYMPVIFVQVAPFCCLLATLYTFARLNRDNEIIAMRSSGLNIFDITKTIIIFGFMISMVVFWVNDRFVPHALVLNQKIKYQMDTRPKKGQEKEKETITNLSMYGLRNRLFFVNKFSPSINTMEGIIILEQDENQNITRKIVANKGVYSSKGWTFYQTITYDFDINGQVKYEPRYSDEELVPIPEGPEEFLAQRQSPEIMTISQLNDYLWKLSKSGAINVVKRLKVDLYQRYTAPLLSLIIVLLGIPFSFKMRKRATGVSSLGISIILAFLYYVLNAMSIALGKGEVLMPFLAASLSHIIALSFSLYMIFTLP